MPASRKLGREEARRLARGAERILVAKGTRRDVYTGGARVDDEAIEAMLGPTGNLRAPTLRAGDVVIVGFGEDQYEEVLS